MDNRTVMILGAGQLQVPILQRAKEKGYRVVVVSPENNQPGLAYADNIVQLDVRDEEGILRAAIEYGIDGITTDQTDLPVRTAAYVADRMGLPSVGYEIGCLFTDKYKQREKCKELGIPSPKYKLTTSLEEALDAVKYIGFPCIIKPIDSQASHGVSKIENESDIKERYEIARSYSRRGGGYCLNNGLMA